METAHADGLTGRTLDRRYLVRSRIAHGGMATVYLATDTRLDREVALKVMHADLARDGEFVGRFIGEAKSVARLSHPNIVAVFDQGADGQYLYLAMEYVPGRTLRSLLRERHWLPWTDALALAEPVLAGLAAAHQAGIVHRDVKPENVLIAADGRVKMVDFGLARASAAAGNTRAGMIIGSVAYIAPEQVAGAVTDARCDVYATGVMLFEMLTGRQPHTGETPLAVAYAHVNSDVPSPAGLVPGLPPAVDHLVRASTSRDPSRRPADAGAFLQAVRALRGTSGPPAPVAAGAGVAAAWAPPGGGEPAIGSHTMIVGTGHDGAGHGGPGQAVTGRYDAGAYHYGGAGYNGETFGGALADADGRGGREPFLQRWLFSRRLGYLAAAVVALTVLAGAGWWFTTGRYVPLPSVGGMPVALARHALRQDGFGVRVGSSVIDDNVAKGKVITTSPSGRALPGATVALTVSLGPRMITVPPVAGLPLAKAKAKLRAAGLTVSQATRPVGVTGTVVLGAVAGTRPAAGTSWPENRPVFIDVVAGLTLPHLVGQDIGSIQQWAAANHVTLRPTNVPSKQPQGIIVSQSPAPGTPVKPGQAVSVSVSQGPPMVQIPNVVGESFQQAQRQLEQAGFKVVGKQFFFGQKVYSISPSGQALAGSTITVYYGF